MEHFPEFENDVEFTERLIAEQSVHCLPATVSAGVGLCRYSQQPLQSTEVFVSCVLALFSPIPSILLHRYPLRTGRKVGNTHCGWVENCRFQDE